MYRTIFAIDLLHGYFADAKSRGLRIAPAEDCLRLFRSHRLTFRQIGSRAYILGWLDENSVPIVPFDPTTVFRFYVIVDDSAFYQYTALPFDPAEKARFYFSNLTANSANSRNYPTAAVPAFDTGTNYALGDLAASGGNVFECIRSLAANPGNSTGDTAHWTSRGALQAPSELDLLPFGSANESISLPAPVTNTTVEVFGLNRATGNFDAPIFSVPMQFDPATDQVPAPLGKLAPGKYRVSVSGVEKYFYHDAALRPGAVVGIIEIFNHLPATSTHSLLQADGTVKETIFAIHFLNPLVLWRYVARTTAVKKIHDQSGTYDFDDSVPQEFLSTTPIAIREEAYDQIAMDYKPAGNAQTTYTKIKNPALGNFTRATVGSDSLPCAEIFLNY